MHNIVNSVKIFSLAVLLMLVPQAAMAYTLQCSMGVPSGGDVFLGVASCTQFRLEQPFSSLNCHFQMILNEVAKRMYCGIQYQLGYALQTAIALYVMIYGLMFMMGLTALTAKELVIRLIKIALIWAFATNAAWGVGLAFYFLVGGIETLATILIQVFFGGISGQSFIGYIDHLIFNQLIGSMTDWGIRIVGFFATLAILVLPVFLLFMVYVLTVTAALTRTVVGYLLGISAIAFLIALSPIFVSFALFKPTYTFFDSWLRYLVSFSMQVVLIFAAVALWIYVMYSTGIHLFDILGEMIVPYKDMAHSQASFAIFNDTWGICYSGRNAMSDITGLCADGSFPDPPAVYSADGPFISWITTELLIMGTLVYAFDVLIRMMPDLARQLSGPAFAPQLGGGAGFGSIEMPGFSAVGRLKENMMYQAKSGILGKFVETKAQIEANLTGQGAAGNAPANKAQQAAKNVGQLANPPRKSP